MAGMGSHRRCLGLRPPPVAGRPRGLPAGDQRVRTRRGRADASERAVRRRLLARPRRGSIHGDRRDDGGGAGDTAGVVLPLGDPLGPAAGIRTGRPDLLRRGGGDRALGAGARSGACRCRRAVAPALAAGAVVLDSQELEFSFDRAGDVVVAEPVAQTESHRLIEQLMIAANEQVAQRLQARHVPTLFRVHERPDTVAVARLIEQLESLGVPTPPVPKGHLTPQQAAEVVGEASALVSDFVQRTGRGRRALTSLVLRSLKQAYYDHRNLGHAGLASANYCHFTSPIRRYPDLICHRALLSAVAGEPEPEASWVAAAGPWTSAREREAMTIERDADDIARCFVLERELGESGRDSVFDGEVVGLIGAGAFVEFGPAGRFEGMLPVRRLRGDWWELNEAGTMLRGTRGGGAIRLGDAVRVRVGRIEAPRGRVDLLPAADAASEED